MAVKEKQSPNDSSTSSSAGTSNKDMPKMDRIAGHTTGLMDDLKSWIELKIEYVKLDVKDEIDTFKKQFALQLMAAGVFAIAGLFALVTMALGLGAWLGHPAWGFLIVTIILAVAAAIIKKIGDRAGRTDVKVGPYSYSVNDDPAKIGEHNGASNQLPTRPSAALEAGKSGQIDHGKNQQ